MATFMPAIRAKVGELDYFISVVTFGEAARLVQYVEDVDAWTSETPSELKLQRKLNIQRVEREMVPYLVASDDHFYSALTIEIRPIAEEDGLRPINFETKQAFPGGLQFGVLTLDGTESLYALDGQHRLKSIDLAIRQRPELAKEHIALILVPFQSIVRSQTLFSDLNRYAKGPSKSISLLFTHREGLARVTKKAAHNVPLLKDRVNMESTSLSSNSRQFITLSTLYEMTKSMIGDVPIESDNEQEVTDNLINVWKLLTPVIPQWTRVANEEEHPAYLRQRYLNMHGVGQQAIALATAHARNEYPESWERVLNALSEVDWQLTNQDWQGVAIHGGRVNNTATSVRMLSESLKGFLDRYAATNGAQTTGGVGQIDEGLTLSTN